MSRRHFLFLQGLPGPALRLIARRLENDGHRTSRINCNGGDLADWGWNGTPYRGSSRAFASWLLDHCQNHQVSDIVLFGAKRPLHCEAIECARKLAIDVHVMEEGYLRPNTVAIECWRGGSAWQPPRSLADCAGREGDLPLEINITSLFSRRLREAMAYWLWTMLLTPLFPQYRSHRPLSAIAEALLWVRRTIRRPGEQRLSRAELSALSDAPFFLFPLQLDGDAQLLHRSTFASMAAAVDLVLVNFARAAPCNARIVIKRHPFDPDRQGWRRQIKEIATKLGISKRVYYVEFADLDALLEQCAGVITVNSTVGGLALRRGKPVHALGEALYAIPGLASQGDPDLFWATPTPLAPDGFAQFSRLLNAECLVNAGFHSREGLALLAEHGASRLVNPPC